MRTRTPTSTTRRSKSAARAPGANLGGTGDWVAAGETNSFARLLRPAAFETRLPPVAVTAPALEDVIYDYIRRSVSHLGPTTASVMAKLCGIAASEIAK